MKPAPFVICGIQTAMNGNMNFIDFKICCPINQLLPFVKMTILKTDAESINDFLQRGTKKVEEYYFLKQPYIFDKSAHETIDFGKSGIYFGFNMPGRAEVLLNIDKLYKNAISGGKTEENLLFSNLTEIFELFIRHRVRNAEDCREIVQDTLMSIAGKYRNMEFHTGFSAWAYSILKYKLVDYYRGKLAKKERFTQVDSPDEIINDMQSDPEFERQIMECLRNLNNINPRYFRILSLRYHGFEFKDICEQLNMTANNVYITLFRARQMLKKCLQGVETSDE